MTQEIVEEALGKSGLPLFKELLRFYPIAEPEDYIKMGAFDDEKLRLDIQLFEAHRREAGADDPLELSEVPDVSLPQSRLMAGTAAARLPGSIGMPGVTIPMARPPGVTLPAGKLLPLGGAVGARPAATAAATASSSAALLAQVKQATAASSSNRPVAPKASSAVSLAATQPSTVTASTPGDMQRLLQLFATKWQMNLPATKTIMEKLSPTRRKYVQSMFTSTTTGDAALTELEAYIKKCEKDGAWGTPDSTAGSAGASATAPPAGAIGARALAPTPRPGLAAAKPGQVKTPLNLAARPSTATPSVAVAAASGPRPAAATALQPGLVPQGGVKRPLGSAGSLTAEAAAKKARISLATGTTQAAAGPTATAPLRLRAPAVVSKAAAVGASAAAPGPVISKPAPLRPTFAMRPSSIVGRVAGTASAPVPSAVRPGPVIGQPAPRPALPRPAVRGVLLRKTT
mmetsp:Transcript_62251/g.148562  ORF Transcript_62251/g.148562 Transcript_62251/m.148562 type:complete len:459 (-) Transcript_62251:178-1554(-)